jgi:predicted RNA-binding protein with PUA-like domain
MRHWLIKFAPFRTSWSQVVRAGTFTLRGVRSPEARNHLAVMRVGDPVLFYHSQEERAIVGILEVTREAYPDPTSADSKWLTCDFCPVQPLPRTIGRDELAMHSNLRTLALIRQPRLAVSPVTQEHFALIVSLPPAESIKTLETRQRKALKQSPK